MEPVTRARALWIPGLIAALALLGACSGGESAPDGGATAGARTTAAAPVTHDLLPASRSGIYVVGGVLFATTVRILPGAAEAER